MKLYCNSGEPGNVCLFKTMKKILISLVAFMILSAAPLQAAEVSHTQAGAAKIHGKNSAKKHAGKHGKKQGKRQSKKAAKRKAAKNHRAV